MKNVDMVLVMICLFSAAMIGCEEEKVDPIAGKVDPIAFVEFVAATPPSGSTIQTDESITVVFDGIPRSVVVTAGTAKTTGQTVTISGPFKVGPLKLRITWHNGSRFLNYTATAPKVDPIAFVAATPSSGSEIQTDESITVVFDGIPGNVAVTAGTAKTTGQTVTISGPFKAGPLNLTIAWSGGAHVLNYTVISPKADLVAFVAATPPSGSEIQTDESITVVFDGTPANVAVTAGTAKTTGQTVTISGPFKAGPLNLTITWSDGAHVLNYTATAPKADLVAFVAATPPSGSAIQTDESITVVFDGTPANVAVTAGTAKTAGQTVTISGPFKAGPLNLTIAWSGGAHVLNYTVISPKADLVAFVAATPPSGSEILADENISVFFDGIPGNVAVSADTAKNLGPTVISFGPFKAGPLNTIAWTMTISGPFKAGPLNLTITWNGGAHVLNYVVAIPEPEPELPPPPQIGKPAIEFHVNDLDGGDLSLVKYRGKIILLDFWAVWCPPCRAETPHLKRAYEKFKNEGFEIIGISLDHDRAKLLQYIKEEDITWPQFFDKRWVVARPYRIAWIPHNFLIDHEGVIRKSGLRGGALEPAIAELIQERNAN